MLKRLAGKTKIYCDACGDAITMFGSMASEHEHFCDECSTPANQEFRVCSYCGEPMIDGYTVEGGFWYCCEGCFPKMLEKDYPEGLRENLHEDDSHWCGGYYDYLHDGKWLDTGIFYTDWL